MIGMTAYVYPANSVLCGPIEQRFIVRVGHRKVWYDREDKYGYIGSKRDGVFFTYEQAEAARNRDIERERWEELLRFNAHDETRDG